MSSVGDEVVTQANGQSKAQPPATTLVETFLNDLAKGDIDAAAELLAENVDYINVSLPTIRSRDLVRRVLKSAMARSGAGFEVYIHSIAAEGDVVLTERTDVLTWGPFRSQFWVCGRFDVRDGQIVVWKDYFDWWDITLATLRGVVGMVIPSLRAHPPVDRQPGDQPPVDQP